MKVSELIIFLNALPQDEVVYLLNGVSGGGPLAETDFDWNHYRKGPRPGFHGPTKPVLCIYGE